MARQNRQERRARRAQQQPALAGGPPQRPPVAPPAPTAQSESEPRRPRREAGTEGRRIPGSGAIRFIQESIAELKKVEWPSQKAVVSGTAVVLIACVIVGTYLWLNDQLWKYVVQHLLLR
jgi:preprotein translocase subunit SecE